MGTQIFSMLVLGAIIAIGTWKSIHIGVLALVAAFGVGTLIGGQTIKEVMAGFPVGILVLLLGITYLFSIVRESGVIDWIVQQTLRLVGGRVFAIPWVFFLLAALLGSMGSSLTSLALAPIAMIFAGRHRLHPLLMALTIVLGGGAGGFAPTSLFGIITNGIAADNGIEPQPWALFAAGFGINAVLFTLAFVALALRNRPTETNPSDGGPGTSGAPVPVDGSPEGTRSEHGDGATATATAVAVDDSPATAALSRYQLLCLAAVAALMTLVLVFMFLDIESDVGVLALALALVISVLYPSRTREAVKGVDWSTILLVGGILTYVGVMQKMGTVELLGHAAESIGSPFLAAFALCFVAALVSAFASTTGILGALIPLAVPVIAIGGLPGFGLIMAIAISSNLVDSTPFSSPGATCIANAQAKDRSRLTKLMLAWGFSMIILGPIITIAVLVVPGM
ncbi:SLC13 family permease [Rhodococcus pyridinivorans]|uniref:SLC13 family permease n=1 Tax=Rhodococcus pyridinivorans TaxID=103816 RepID=UPI0022835A13|nr:SLC13 family permease [Rhodococcus pyridinivorans]WAL47347.1 SLC13 family permease [Rhodococcus pyridinivorans]